MLEFNSNMEANDLRKAMEELRKGSAEAFRILYRKFHKGVYRFCLRMLGDTAAADDAFQETFIKVYEHRREFRGKNFTAWLFTIARRTCLNSIRTRRDHDSFDEFFYKPANEKQSDIGLKDCIEDAMSTLPIALKEALLLREYEDCSYQEIADILGIQLSLAKVRVYRAREILRKLLAPLRHELHES